MAGRLSHSILAVCLPAVFAACRAAPAPVEHVILVTLDTLRADHLPFYGYPRDTAPFLDRLASQGLVFENFSAMSSHTTPSHGSIFTGLYPYQHGAVGNGTELSEDVGTLAEAMAEQGFTTAAFSGVRFLEKLGRGFDSFDGQERQARRRFRPGEETRRAAEQWLETRGPGERVFLWLHLFDAHEYSRKSARYAAARAAVEADDDLGAAELGSLLARMHGVDESNRRMRGLLEMTRRYDGRIRYLDEQLEAFHSVVEAAADGDPTLWVVAADHGEALGDHSYVGHGRYLYEEQLRVPLLLWASDGRLEAGREAALVRQIDLMPTILELAGIAVDEGLEGRSLLGPGSTLRAANGPATAFAQRRTPLGGEPAGTWALRDQRYKMIVDAGQREEIYDLLEDPLESRDLSASPPPAALNLRTELRDRLAAANEAETRPVADEYLEELRALGYVQ